MISAMTKYSFILLNGEQDGFLERLQELGLVDITRSVKPVDGRSSALLSKAESLKSLSASLMRIDFPEGLEATPVTGDLAATATEDLDRLASLESALATARKDAAARLPWGEFDATELARLTDAGYRLHFHTVTSKSFRPEWAEQVPLQVISEQNGKTRFVTILPAGEGDILPDEVPAPAASYRDAETQAAALEQEILPVKARLLGARGRVSELEASCKRELVELDRYLASAAAVPAAEDKIVSLVGYAPTDNEEAVTAYLEKTGVFYLKDAASVEDNPPIQFKNNKFVKMFEVLTDMYGRPAYDGFDPTPFIAVFFLLFFALCMGDAGYGLVLIVIGLLMKKSERFKGMAPLVVTLGIGTAVVGFFLHTFFSIDIAQWKVFEPVKFLFLPDEIAGYAGGMVLSIVVGIIHLCLAMVVKAINEVRVKGIYASLGTLGWTLLIVGGVIVGGIALTGALSSGVVKGILIVLGIVSALGIFVFNDPERNKFANVGMGLWDTYNTATGLLGDVLSYLRLYALGLAGGMLGMAFNDMGKMVLGDGSSIGLWIPFILLVLIGHTLNIAMCALGAFVHPLRLNFLEFFKNSGYEAAGRNYNPLKKQ
ncbi:MAG: ATPase V [Bacteroidales bacterium]|nr:ATPase V [Bacteroidales bacterium]